MTIHVFATSAEAYDASQCHDDIVDGDILLVPSEEIAGWLSGAWPIAVTCEHGEFHQLNVAYAIEHESLGPDTRAVIDRKTEEAIGALAAHNAVEALRAERAKEDEAHAINTARVVA
ncbi:hypothetical protein [Nocardia bovistercoris]|uniref:Uncharacterized protein n=1 Tax=Nocardia bovistercoris TaxID=2785916 RepID=A0A931IET9_9NOCA|nr:hypothetical protein [Nocardia bovistercoris]MBH0778787.1 hypothetical protein [Nocardia bovistercoris]